MIINKYGEIMDPITTYFFACQSRKEGGGRPLRSPLHVYVPEYMISVWIFALVFYDRQIMTFFKSKHKIFTNDIQLTILRITYDIRDSK